MNVATLRTILEHLPGDLTVHVAGRGEVQEVRRNANERWLTPGVFLDTGERLRLKGRFVDRRTLDVRLEAGIR
jgi:hypothetical protein